MVSIPVNIRLVVRSRSTSIAATTVALIPYTRSESIQTTMTAAPVADESTGAGSSVDKSVFGRVRAALTGKLTIAEVT
jgi:hypothetical protein